MLEPLRHQIMIERIAEAQSPASAVDDGRRKLRRIALPTLCFDHRIDAYVCEGPTIAGHIAALGWPSGRSLNVFVTIDGHPIPEAQWEYCVPRTNQSLVIRCIPMGVGGAGGGGGKTAIRIVAMLAVIAMSIFLPQVGLPVLAGQFSGGAAGFLLSGTNALMAGAVLTVAGSLALSAVVPPARPRLDQREDTPCLRLLE